MQIKSQSSGEVINYTYLADGGKFSALDFGARFYNADIGRWLTQDPMAEKFYGFNPYNFCLNNPIRYTDPFGLEPQSSRQVGVKDIYFDENGFYLGVDDRPTNNVRIMPRDVWYALGGKNGLIVNVKSTILDDNSALFSEATFGTHVFLEPIGSSTILSVYRWIANNFLNLFVHLDLNNSLGEGIVMQSHSIPDMYGINIEKQTIDINHELMAQKKFCDNIFNIASVFVHERQHLRDAKYVGLNAYKTWKEDFQEWHAYTTQIIYNPYWALATPVFQAYIMNTYRQYNK